jgi:hypothetical protein
MRSATSALEAVKRCPPGKNVAKDKAFTQQIEIQFNP